MTRVAWTAGAWLLAASPAFAQPASLPGNAPSIGVAASLASLWDDETHLGRGAALAAEVNRPLGPHLRIGVEGGWFHHSRDSGYLIASGDVLQAAARVALLMGPREWRTRPFIGAGAGLSRSTGSLTTRDPLALPVELRREWTLTRPSVELHAGLRIAGHGRWAVRPELRAGVVGGSSDVSTIEPPLLRLQGGVAIEWMSP